MRTGILYLALAAVLLVAHHLLLPYLVIVHVVPDILLLLIVIIALREGQTAATVAGFLIGLLIDLTGGDASVTGLSAMCKSAAGFLAGYFHRPERSDQILGSLRFVAAVGISAFVHNIVYFVVYLLGTGIPVLEAILTYAVPGALYTTTVSLLPMFYFSRRYSG